MMDAIKFTIHGEPASKANSRRLVTIRQRGKPPRPGFIKSEKALNYVEVFRMQCPKLKELLAGDVAVTMTIYYASRRPDLDGSVIQDCMQGRIIANDRQIKELHLYWRLDRERPRAEIEVRLTARG